ncbi:zinc finger protein 652-like [Branchiostoma lanceolatum]|uniref:zinc finger protein 652-like n=1 Tax=Branchiostoma lanceolatum TaxID=7740 RepID=UPI00345257FC
MEWQAEGAAAPDAQPKEEGSQYDHLIEVFLLYQCRVCQFSSVESKNSILSHIRTKHCKSDGTLQEVELFSASISVFGENFANTLSGGARPHTSDRNSSGREALNLGSSPGRFVTKATVKAVREVIDTSSLKSAKSQKSGKHADGEETYRFLGNSDDEEVSDLGKDKDPDYRPSGVRRTIAVYESDDDVIDDVIEDNDDEGENHSYPLKKRVRRSKVADPEEAEKAEDDGIEKEAAGSGVRTRRGRGRPRKLRIRLQEGEGVKRKRGRPRKAKPEKQQKRKFLCSAAGCGYRPLTQETLELHQKCHIEGADDFRCFLCDHITSRWSSMHVHINYSHKNMYYCQECEYSTRALPFLKRHMADKHLHSALCEQCGRSFPSSSYLALHVIEEHGDKSKHKCPQCAYTTPYEHELQQHLTCHLPQFTCKVCGEKFAAKMELAGHIQILHPGEKIFFCDFCSYTAKLKHHLENHMNSQHTPRGVFPCPDCGKVYKTQHHMDDHR